MRDIRGSEEKFTSADLRKIQKPVVEKRRRLRINQSLDQLKALILGATQQEFLSGPRDAKLEKAEILEMTVKYLRNMQRRQLSVASAVDPTVGAKYRAGFSECAQEVAQYMSKVDGLTPEMRMRLMNHLTQCAHNVNTSMTSPGHMSGVHAHAHVQVPVASGLAGLPGSPGFAHGFPTSTHVQNQNRNLSPFTSASHVAVNVMLGNGQMMPCYIPGVFGHPRTQSRVQLNSNMVKEEPLSPKSQVSENSSNAVDRDSVLPEDDTQNASEHSGDREEVGKSDTQSNADSNDEGTDDYKQQEVNDAHAPSDDENMWRPW